MMWRAKWPRGDDCLTVEQADGTMNVCDFESFGSVRSGRMVGSLFANMVFRDPGGRRVSLYGRRPRRLPVRRPGPSCVRLSENCPQTENNKDPTLPSFNPLAIYSYKYCNGLVCYS